MDALRRQFCYDTKANTSADLKLSCLFIGDDSLVCRKNRDAEAAKYLWKLIFAGIHTKTRLGIFLICNDLLILICTIFQSNAD